MLQRNSSTSVFNRWRKEVEDYINSRTQQGMSLDPDLVFEQTLLLLEPDLAGSLKAKMQLAEDGEKPDIYMLIRELITDDIIEARCLADVLNYRRLNNEGIAEYSLNLEEIMQELWLHVGFKEGEAIEQLTKLMKMMMLCKISNSKQE